MNKSLEQTLEFSKTFNQHIGNLNEIEPLKVRQQRIKLIFEELKEYVEASDVRKTFQDLCKNEVPEIEEPIAGDFSGLAFYNAISTKDGDNVNKIEQLDALTDLTVVIDGSKIAGGFHEIDEDAANLVFRNNMNKAHNSQEHINETASKLGISLKSIQKDNKWLAYNDYGKLIKPHDHIKVELSTLFENK